MLPLFVSLLLTPWIAAADAPAPVNLPLAAGVQIRYHGTLEAQIDDPAPTRKAFDLTLWVTQKSETGAEVFWLLNEQGRGEFPWFEHFGRASFDAFWHSSSPQPSLLYDRGEGRSVVSIAWPLLAHDQPLAPGVTFHEGKLDFTVEKAGKVGEQPVWVLSARDPFGPQRTVRVAQSGPVVLSQIERMTLGRGEPYQLKLEWTSSEQVPGESLTALAKVIDKLTALRGKLNLPAQTQETAWRGEQLQLLQGQLPALAELALATPLASLVEIAHADLKLQTGRVDAVAEQRTKQEGREVAPFTAKGFAGDSLNADQLRGKVTVLHFWDYRDEPLKEPYGQVGYLEFLHHRRKGQNVQVYGVAVDGRLTDEKTRGAAERSVKKLKDFMNLSYPVLLDGGSLLKQFGDPRPLGATLPLFIVIDPAGKIAHYHVGHYDVHQDQGLKELDQAVACALESK